MSRNLLTVIYRIAAGAAIVFAIVGIVFPLLIGAAVALAVAAVVAYRIRFPSERMFTRRTDGRTAQQHDGPILNPATGLLMVGGVDTGGNLYGVGRRLE